MADPIVPAPVKPGVFTSEFILNLIQTIGGGIMSLGVIPHSTATGVLITQGLGTLLVLASVTHWTWIRANLKKVAIDAGVAALKAVEDDVNAGG